MDSSIIDESVADNYDDESDAFSPIAAPVRRQCPPLVLINIASKDKPVDIVG
jgi:hypothetical protein